MKLAVSNLALPAYNHLHLLPRLAAMGVRGIELAPARTWPDSRNGLGASAIGVYRRAARQAGLDIVGLHDLLADRPELGIFADAETRRRTLGHLTHLSAVCRDLGGRTLVLGSRWRDGVDGKLAWAACRAFLEELLPRIEGHGTQLCFAPLAPEDGDFAITARECRMLAYAVEHDSLALHFDTAALAANGESGHFHFAGVRGSLEHVHVTDPGRAPVGSTGLVDHGDLECHLRAIGYRGWVSLVQRRPPAADPLAAIAEAVSYAGTTYLRPDRAPGRTENSPAEVRRHGVVAAAIEAFRPRVRRDNGDLRLIAVDGDQVTVRLSGACTTCVRSGETLGSLRRSLIAELGRPVTVVPRR